ncbi:MAG: sigma-54 factor interaction domain-containing protein, partial [Nitrospirota bacterium]|nr:sigma-54 factor interaction domain-containing protein [Nitrospirota bacterium]
MRTKTLHGRSSAHLALLHTLAQLARTDVEVLITGPTGVGKELYARFLHQRSQRGNASFVPLNCGALVDTLFENELFGHVGGAFTGARQQSKGLIESAEGGTLFLDEVDSLSAASQIKLLRLLQEKEYRKLGETRLRTADVRVVAATNTRLDLAVQKGNFREDLFFRLRVAPVYVPP